MTEQEKGPEEKAPPPDPRLPETRERSGDFFTTADIPPDPRWPETAFEEPPPDPKLPETKDGGDPGDISD